MDSKGIHKAMTAAERQRKRRQKMKENGTYDQYKKKHIEEVRRSRQKQKEDLLKLPESIQSKIQLEKRLATRKRVAVYRAKKEVELEFKARLKDDPPNKINGKTTDRPHCNLASFILLPHLLYFMDVCQNTVPSRASEISPSP